MIHPKISSPDVPVSKECIPRSELSANLILRPEMVEMVKSMEYKLGKNDHKRPWSSYDPPHVWWLLTKLREEVDELEEAILSASKSYNSGIDEIVYEAADVANFALMIHALVLKHQKVESP